MFLVFDTRIARSNRHAGCRSVYFVNIWVCLCKCNYPGHLIKSLGWLFPLNCGAAKQTADLSANARPLFIVYLPLEKHLWPDDTLSIVSVCLSVGLSVRADCLWSRSICCRAVWLVTYTPQSFLFRYELCCRRYLSFRRAASDCDDGVCRRRNRPAPSGSDFYLFL